MKKICCGKREINNLLFLSKYYFNRNKKFKSFNSLLISVKPDSLNLGNEIKSGQEIRKIACRKCRDTENKLKKHFITFHYINCIIFYSFFFYQ